MISSKQETTPNRQTEVIALLGQYRDLVEQQKTANEDTDSRRQYKKLCSLWFEFNSVYVALPQIISNSDIQTLELNDDERAVLDEALNSDIDNTDTPFTQVSIKIFELEETDDIKTLLQELSPSFDAALRALTNQCDRLTNRVQSDPENVDLLNASNQLNEIQSAIVTLQNEKDPFIPDFEFRVACLHILQNQEARAVFASPRGSWSLLRLLDDLIATVTYCTGIPLSRPSFFKTTTEATVDDVITSLTITK
jgi:hypothetical protein